jgi:hypothetical protein
MHVQQRRNKNKCTCNKWATRIKCLNEGHHLHTQNFYHKELQIEPRTIEPQVIALKVPQEQVAISKASRKHASKPMNGKWGRES